MAYDPSMFEARRRGLMQNYAAEGAMNAYSRFLAQQRGQRTEQDLERRYQKDLPQLMRAYGQRGLAGPSVRSGIQRSGLREFAGNRIRDIGELRRGLSEELRIMDLQDAQRMAALQTAQSDLEFEKARQIAEDAQAVLARRAGAY